MKAYRGTKDILPHRLDHRRITPAVFGEATYFALDEKGAEFYTQGGQGTCKIVTHYEIILNNVLEINSSEWENIGSLVDAKQSLKIKPKLQEKLDYQNDFLSPVMLSKVLTQSGFEGALLTGYIEGGPQLVIPPNECLIQVLGFDMVLSKDILGRSKKNDHVQDFVGILKDYDVQVVESGQQLKLFIDSKKLPILIPIFEFIETISQGSFAVIDFKTLRVELEEKE